MDTDDTREAGRSLPFDEAKQEAIVGHALVDQKFFLQLRSRIPARWFVDPRVSEVYTRLDKFYQEYGRYPLSLEEVRTQFSVYDQGERAKFHATLALCVSQAERIGLDVIRKELTGWMRAGKMADLIHKATQFYNGEEVGKAHSWAAQKIEEIRQCSFDEDAAVSFEDPASFLAQTELDREHALTTGIPAFDQALLEGATDGGMLRGDMTVVLAPKNVGKTCTLITVAVQNVWRRKDVLFITHEGRPQDIKLKLLCSSIGVSVPELLGLYKTPEGLDKIRLHSALLGTYLTYIPFNAAGGMYVEDVVDLIKTRQMDLRARKGKGFDLVVDDYPMKLTSKLGKNLGEHRHIQTYVYDQFVQIALQEKTHALVAAQTNRDGSRANRASDRFLTDEDVAECFGIMMIATSVITLNRSDEDMAHNRITFYVSKSRASETGIAITCRSDFRCARTHHASLGHVAQRTNVPIREEVEILLAQANLRRAETAANDSKANQQ